MSALSQFVIPVGTSEPLDFELRDEGVAIDGSEFAVELEIKQLVDGVPTAVESAPTVAWLDEAAGQVRVTGADALEVGNYLVRYKVTDGGDKSGYFPNGDKADLWRVVAIAAR